MKIFLLFVALFVCARSFCQQTHSDHNTQGSLGADSVLSWLKAGNNDFVAGKFNVHGVDSSLRMHISKEQHPKAVILTCSDSRVPPELIFDKGLGDLFVIRVAGNISDDAVVASIEYAVEHLNTPLVVVMGHKGCGAIGAAVTDLQNPENEIDDHVRILTDKIEQAVTAVNLHDSDLTHKALLSNIIFTRNSLRQTRPVLYEAVREGKLKVVGAVYDLASGKVSWLEN